MMSNRVAQPEVAVVVVNGPEEDAPVVESPEVPEQPTPSLPPSVWLKHPLKHTWVWWYFKNDRNRDWCENNVSVKSFAFVEDFWALINHIQKASKLSTGCDYSVFKEGIQPMWEDEMNKEGGRWLINLNKTQRLQGELDEAWCEVLLCLIGELFGDAGDEVCGAVINIRGKGDKISVWTRDWNSRENISKIGRVLKDQLKIPKNHLIGYQSHVDTSTKTGSTVKNRYQQ